MLQVESIVVRFGGLVAVNEVSLDVPLGSVTGLIGPNGSGKTTTFDVMTGLRRPQSGRVLLDGRVITRASAGARARMGVGRTFQRLELFGNLSVRDNVLVAAEAQALPAAAAAAADELLDRLGLREVADAPADVLPTGLARLVELGRALATKPRVLLLDEPGSGLDADESAVLGSLLGEVAAAGTGVLVVEHDMDLIMRVCSRIHVLDLGRVIASGSPAEVQASERVQQAYLGAVAGAAR